MLLCGKYIQNNMYKILLKSAGFCRRCDIFSLHAVPIAVHLQNANAKFYKVVKRNYSGEVVDVYIPVLEIYSRQYTPNFYQNRPGFVFFC